MGWDMEVYLFIIVLALVAVIVILLTRPRTVEVPTEIRKTLENLPSNVVRSLTASLAVPTGKLHELLATYELIQYDRIFYLGEPIDFVGIKYGEAVDFIEVKSGKSKLSGDEKKLRELVEAKQVRYVLLKLEKVGLAEAIDAREKSVDTQV